MRSLSMSGIGSSFTMGEMVSRRRILRFLNDPQVSPLVNDPEVFAAELGHLTGMQCLEEVYADRSVLVGPGHPLQGSAGVSLAPSLKTWTGGA